MSRGRSAGARLGEAAPVFAALADPTRLALVATLCAHGPLSIARLREGTDVTRQAVTKHLRTLEAAGLVQGTRAGRERIWELEPRRLEIARRALAEISQHWDAAIARLQNYVERER